MNKTELTVREREVLNNLPSSRDELAEDLGITKSTLRDHLSSIRNKGVDFDKLVEESGEEYTFGVEQTPPAPEKLKNDLYFDRANQCCEWCETWVDQPHVHHIKPRREGGPNNRMNLIVLCPNCHTKADRGAISRSKLKAKLRRIDDARQH